MRTLGKIMLLAVLALPMGSVFAAPQDTLTVNITVTVAIDVNVEFADGANGTNTSKSWTIANANLGQQYTSSTAATPVLTQIQNNRPFQVDVSVAVTTSPTHWSLGPVGTNNFQLSYVDGGAPVPLPSALKITVPPLTPPATPGVSDPAAELQLTLPANVTHTTPGGNIVVTYVATATP